MKIVVTGGGTGGHIYPGTAFIKYVQQVDPTAQFLYIGATRGMENTIIPQTGLPFIALENQGFKRSLSPDNFKTIWLFLKSVHQAKKILHDFQPDVVIGTGGYVSGAVMYAAARLKIPTIVHEQNSVPGLTNKFLSRFVSRIGISLPSAREYFPKEKTVLVGNPRGQEISGMEKSDALKSYDLNPNKPTVLIFGGSQGSLKINQAVLGALAEFAKKDYQILYASGKRYYEEIDEKIGMTKDAFKNISIQPYIHNMAEVMVNCDLVICRAGATSIAEITSLGIPAILIPSPYVTNDHQTKNAAALEKAGAVRMIKDQELTEKNLIATVDEIMQNKDLHDKMAQAAKGQGIIDASHRLYQLVLELTSK